MAEGNLSDSDFASVNRDVDAALRELRDQLALCESNTLDMDTAFGYLQYLLWNTLICVGKQRFTR
jgi:hypothetical protein